MGQGDMGDRFKDTSDEVRKEYPWFYPTIVGAGLVFILAILGWQLFGTENPVLSGNALAYAMNLWSSGVSIGAGVFIIDQIYRRRDRLAVEQADRERLVIELRSRDNGIAVNALEQIAARNWLRDGTLAGGNFAYADLFQADFTLADLEGAMFFSTRLQEAEFVNAYLYDANFYMANLQRANFNGANLYGADLSFASLKGAFLGDACLINAILANTLYDEMTILPDAVEIGFKKDGSFLYDKHWTPETDMSRYTDPNHPDFWEPDWVKQKSREEE